MGGGQGLLGDQTSGQGATATGAADGGSDGGAAAATSGAPEDEEAIRDPGKRAAGPGTAPGRGVRGGDSCVWATAWTLRGVRRRKW